MSEIRVPFVDLKLRFEEEKTELLDCVERVLSQGHLVMTPEVGELEEAVKAYTGTRHCVSLNSGTDGLLMALWAAGVGKGDEVITSPVSFVATTGAIVHVGATPVYADVRKDQNIDPTQIEQKITPRTKAIMPVHWTGRMADMDAIVNIAKRHGLMVIEDSAQSMGSWAGDRHGGTFGFAGTISCHPLKNLNAIGDGGMILTDDDEAAEKVRLYRNHGLESRDSVVFYGINSRLDVVSAEVLKFRLTKLDDVIAKRRRNADLYRALIRAPEVFIPEEKDGTRDSYVMFITQAERRDALKAHLAENGVESLIYYGTPLHLHKAAQQFGYRKGDMPEAERQCERVLALPHHQHLTEDQVAYVAEHVNSFYGAT
ncbi:MAG: DegT/DnrJ/EryC1/StrS family aminotransferase [Alphaproteobacteria bacterium]